LLDSRNLVFSGQTTAEGAPSSAAFLFFEDDFLEVFGGLDDQLATTTDWAFFLIPGRRE
jgi:hypothetical protein